MFPEIVDANLNRASEGLRVLEEYARFVASNSKIASQLSELRHQIGQYNGISADRLNARDTLRDTRSHEPPPPRQSITELLAANFHRVTEASRVLEEYTGAPQFTTIRYKMYEIEKTLVLTQLKPPINPGIYVISDDVNVLLDAARRGAVLIQLRDKSASKAVIYTKALELVTQKPPEVPVIINDFLDIALAVNADGLHTGQDDIPLATQRKLMGPHRLLGRTTHSIQQGLDAQSNGADYISVGPIWDTPSKPNRAGIGLAYLEAAREKINIPYVAIGGIDHLTAEHIAPFSPPLVGIIRAIDQLESIHRTIFGRC
ncbi:thiamine phosphate synthase [bacterium]|nr:thiamine phosphate synthase [bacterium]